MDPEKQLCKSNVDVDGSQLLDKETLPKDQTCSSSSDLEHTIQSTGSQRRDSDGQDSDEETDDEDGSPSIAARVLSRITSRSSIVEGPPPDGGLTAWLQCLSVHFVISNTWGWINSFGAWQTYYMELFPERSSFDISMIGSLTVFLLFFIGAFTGRLTDSGFFRQVFIAGSFFSIFGIFATSFCSQYWQFILAQGICIGIGNGMLFCPSLAILSSYFQKRRAIAIGIAASGSVTGGLIFPVMARELLPRIGFPWTIRAIGFIQLAMILVSNFISKPRIKPRKSGPFIDFSAFKELEYSSYAVGAFLIFWGVYFAFYYIAAYSRDALTDPFTFVESLNLLLIINGVGVAGRLIPNYMADRVGAVNMLIPVCASAAVLLFAWMAVETPTGLYIWTPFYGFFAAAFQSLFPTALSFLTTDLRKLGVRMGMVFTIVSFAVLTGPPLAGVIIDRTGSYKGAQAFSGASIGLGTFCFLVSKLAVMRRKRMGWKDKV